MVMPSSLLLPSVSLSRVPTLPPPSLSSANSLFFTSGRGVFLKKSATLSLRRKNSGGAGLECHCLFGLGVPELVVIAGVAALVFGPKKLPEIGRSIGKTVRSFQEATKEFQSELKKDTAGTEETLTDSKAEEETQDAKIQ
ncbi:Sec-independent translocase protein [Nymphaea thermarum]|nr:Sec-independent translocase protein [Nymphaea thermarum]